MVGTSRHEGGEGFVFGGEHGRGGGLRRFPSVARVLARAKRVNLTVSLKVRSDFSPKAKIKKKKKKSLFQDKTCD